MPPKYFRKPMYGRNYVDAPIKQEYVPVIELFSSDSDSCPTESDSDRHNWSDSSFESNESTSNSSVSDLSSMSDSEGDSRKESARFEQGIKSSRKILRDSIGDSRKWRPPSPRRPRLRRQNAFISEGSPFSFGQTCPLGSPRGRKAWKLPDDKVFTEGTGVCVKKRKICEKGDRDTESRQPESLEQRLEEKANGGGSGNVGERSEPIASNGSIHDFLLCSEEEDNRVCPRCSIAEAFYKKVRQGCTHKDDSDDYEYIDIWFDLLAERERSRIKQEDKTTKTEATLATRTPPYRDWETDRKSTRLNSSHEIPSRMPSSA